MAEAGDEVADLVRAAKAQAEPEEAVDSEPEEAVESKPRVKRTSRRTRREKPEKAKTLEDLDVEELLPQGLPKPEQNIKGLGDLYAKYGVGERPEFKVHLIRTYPKIAPGGVKFDGFYDEYDIPITEQQVQADYGGGQYRIAVVGPHPTNPRLPKTYGSHSISLAGEPNWNRVPRALQGQNKPAADTSGNPPPLTPMPSHESPKLAEAALKMFESTAQAEREERRRMEEKMERHRATGYGQSDAVAEAERRRADDLIQSERQRAESERRFMEQRMEEMKREQDDTLRRFQMEQQARPSVAAEIRDLAAAGLFSRGDDGTAKAMLEQILGKHRDEVAAINVAHQEFVRSLRESHQAEVGALRSAHEREVAAEREASRSREDRIEERLKSEREERERDRTRHREVMEERDRHWKDRMEQAQQTQQASWESRHQSMVSTYETRIQWFNAEIDKLKSELMDAKSKQEEKGDVFAQLARYKELQVLMKEFSPSDSSPSASAATGGIGISGGDDWKQAAAEGLVERAPAILEKLFGGGAAAAAQQAAAPSQSAPAQQQFHEGQVVTHDRQGNPLPEPMEVVRNPADGQLALAPKAALDRHRAQVAQAQRGGGGLLPGSDSKKTARSSTPSAVPDFSRGLPRPRPPWEGSDHDPRDAEQPGPLDRHDGPLVPPPPPAPPPMSRMSTRKPETTPAEPLELSAMERQALRLIAKEVHDSVQRADDPDEFVQAMLQKYPPAAMQQVVGGYSDRQIAQGIVQLEPNSAGATPAGRQFVLEAFRLMRHALQSA